MAEDIVREEFGKYKTSDSGSAPLVCLKLSAVIMRLKGSYFQATKDSEFEDFGDIPMDGIEEVDELDEYLSLPIEKVHNPLVWWWDHCHTFPQLSAMAFDFLSAPGMYLFITMLLLLTYYQPCRQPSSVYFLKADNSCLTHETDYLRTRFVLYYASEIGVGRTWFTCLTSSPQ